MQIFVLFYIEGGSYIQEDEDSWEFITLYVGSFHFSQLSDPFSERHPLVLDMRKESVRMLREQSHIILWAIQHCTLSTASPTSSECESGMFPYFRRSTWPL